jgi:hypothetical protein
MVSFPELNQLNADVNLIFNNVWACESKRQGESWSPICLPGCSEEFMLHIYTCFKYSNLGMVLVCTDHSKQCFDQCYQYRIEVLRHLDKPKVKYYLGAKFPNIQDVVDNCTLS